MNKWYVCVFCRKRKSIDEEHPEYISGKFGVCKSCMDKLSFADGDGCFDGTKNISYVIADFYYNDIVRRAIIDYKFNAGKIYADIFSHFLTLRLAQYPMLCDFDCMTCVPLSKQRFRERGYNQSELIAQKAAENLNIPFSNNIVTRLRNTQKQSGLKGIARLYNMSDAFSAAGDLSGCRILLFDDIFTLGLTMDECAKALKNAGAKEVVGICSAIVKN